MLTLWYLFSLVGQGVILIPAVLELEITYAQDFYQWQSPVLKAGRVAISLCLLLFVASIVIDLVKKNSRDALHWIGIVCLFLQLLVTRALIAVALRYLSVNELFGR